jgi:tRNA threonylcarbamoyladenosine biosynthesis protein TsaE
MATLISNSAGETAQLGEAWARSAVAGWVIGLCGDLGAGKTQLVKGLARGAGYSGRVHSPTFALIHVYEGGRVTLYHLDLYRLRTPEEIADAGLEDYLRRPDGVTVVEWAERWWGGADLPAPLRPPDGPYRRVRMEPLAGDRRRIAYEDFGH